MAEKTTTGRLIAAAGGIILIISLFLTWYSFEAKGLPGGIAGGFGIDTSATGWQALDIGDFVLLLAGLAAIAPAALDIFDLEIELPVDPGVVTLGAGILAVAWAVLRFISTPDTGVAEQLVEVNRGIGIIAALIGGALIAFGGLKQQGEQTGGGLTAPDAYVPPAAPAPPPAPAPPQDPPPTPPTVT
ncbi:MAG: hypothetical protein WBK99_03845 [Solirubrobacterales bacterium]